MTEKITPELLLNAYANGYFPMAESRHGKELLWYYPEKRGIVPLEGFHLPRSVAKLLRKNLYDVTFNRAFRDVITGCADRESTWINDEIIALYSRLHELGFAHSVECWKDGALAGGLYGVALGKAFFGESMFSRETGASKVALARLVEWLKRQGFTLLDAQYVNEHLKQFGVVEISRNEYLAKLNEALANIAR